MLEQGYALSTGEYTAQMLFEYVAGSIDISFVLCYHMVCKWLSNRKIKCKHNISICSNSATYHVCTQSKIKDEKMRTNLRAFLRIFRSSSENKVFASTTNLLQPRTTSPLDVNLQHSRPPPKGYQ